MRYVGGIGDDDSNMPVDAGTAVPAAVGLRGIIDADGEHIHAGWIQLRREIEGEGGVAVGMRA